MALDGSSRQAAKLGRTGLRGGAARVGDLGVAVVGYSGAGKSTLTAALVQAGHGFIADEVSAVALADVVAAGVAGASDIRPVLHPYRRPIGIRTGGAEAISVEIPDGPFEYTFPLRAATIGSLVGATPLGLVVFVERDLLAPPQISDVSPAHALHRLSNHTLGTWGLEPDVFPTLDRLVRAVPSVSVNYRTAEEGVALVEKAAAANSAS